MPLKSNIKRVMVIGSGPIVIGQAAEYRNFYCNVRALSVKTCAVTHILELFAEHCSCSEVNHRYACNLTDIRNCS